MQTIRWTETHDYLQLVMKRELETMRQLLDNLHLEEQFIVRGEKKYWSSMMEERAHLKKQLQTLHKDKHYVTKKLESLTEQSNAMLESLLPPQDTNSWEILSMRDQMHTLLERMNLQKSRNEMLVNLIPKQVPTGKKKIGLATLSEEEYKQGDG